MRKTVTRALFVCIGISVIAASIITTIQSQVPDQRNRDRWQQPEAVMDSIGVKQGMVIGEVGAGDGYFTFKLSHRVGEKGKIYANDINSRALRSLRNRCEREGISNIETILGKVDDPLLPKGKLDMVIMVYVFHELEKPVELLNNIKPSLKPGANLVILDQDPQKYGRSSRHFMSKEAILKKVTETDFELVRIETFLPRDNIYIYRLNGKENLY